MAKPNKAGVDKNGFIIEDGFFPKGSLQKLGKTPTKSVKKPSPVTKKGKK